jgi:ketosteroid isomerase-like protein
VSEMKTLMFAMAASVLLSELLMAQGASISATARAGIEAGNQAWIDGMKAGDVLMISATYADDAVDCGSNGECIRGRSDIERHMKAQLARMGRARSAAVESLGSTQQGDFVYEWGRAEATFDQGKGLAEKYLTAWQKQPDGGWKIFRNLVIPNQ